MVSASSYVVDEFEALDILRFCGPDVDTFWLSDIFGHWIRLGIVLSSHGEPTHVRKHQFSKQSSVSQR